MSVWERLGLPPGSSRDDIKRAYARKLKGCNPEDDPEGFKALREAFELATRYADYGFYDYSDEARDEEAQEEAEEEATEAFAETGAWSGGGWPPEPDSGEEPQAAAAPAADFAAGAEQSREAAALEERLARLEALLEDAEPQPDALLLESFEAVLASPALQQLATRQRTERWLAWRIASSIPRSDPLVEAAIVRFGWDDASERHHREPAVARVLARIEEWRFMHAASRPGDPLHLGWLALTRPSAPEWKLRLEGLSQARAAQVQTLLDIVEQELPGLAGAFEPDRLAWWRRYLEKPQLTFETLLLAPLVFYLFCLVPLPVPFAVHMAGAGLLATASPYLYLRFVKQRHHEWLTWQRPWPKRQVALGWMAGAALLPPVAMLMPANAAAALALALLAGALLLWMAIVQLPERSIEMLPRRAAGLVGRLWYLLVFGTSSMVGLTGSRLDQFLVTLNAVAILWWRGRDPMLRELERLVPKWRQAAALGFVAVAAVATAAAGPPGDPETHYLASNLILLCGPLLVLAWHASPDANRFPLVIGWLLLAGLYLSGLPEVPGERPRSPGAQPTAVVAEPLRIEAHHGTWRRPQCPQRPKAGPGPNAPVPCEPHLWVLAEDEIAPGPDGDAAQRVSKLRIEVSPSGAVTQCAAVGPTESPKLAAVACDAILVNARFLPAISKYGFPEVAETEVHIDWLAAAPPASASPKSKAADAPKPLDPEADLRRLFPSVPPPPAMKCPAEPDPPTGPHPLRPCDGGGKWMNEGDYPLASLRRGEEGTTRVLIRVSKEGRPSACTVKKSSGSKTLDQTTCRVVMKRARFLPARNEAGEGIPTDLTFSMTWQLDD